MSPDDWVRVGLLIWLGLGALVMLYLWIIGTE